MTEEMSKERRNEIAYQLWKWYIRTEYKLRDIDDMKRRVGNLLKEREIAEKKILKEELLEFGSIACGDVFTDLMARMRR